MPPKKEVEQETTVTVRNFWHSRRRVLYAVGWTLLFSFAVADLGLVSQQLHLFGNDVQDYANMMFKHILGIHLFSIILIFLMCIGHFYAPMRLMAFFILSAAVFWGTAAGVTFQSCPYRVFNCGDTNPGITFAGTKWGQEIFFRQCSRIVAIQGLAWAEWGVLTFMFFGMIAHIFQFSVRPRTSFYGPMV